MKKTFNLTAPNKKPERQVDSIKHEIKKYIARERKKDLPAGVDYWDFDCKIGSSDQENEIVHISKVNSTISSLATEEKESFYIEILSKPGYRTK